jgi:hypothetical protein
MNFLHNKLQNRMAIETMDILVFIYMNTRSLRQASEKKDWDKQVWKGLFEDILLIIEDDLVAQEDTTDTEE